MTCDILPLRHIAAHMAVKTEVTPESSPASVQDLITGMQSRTVTFFGDIALCKLKEKCLLKFSVFG